MARRTHGEYLEQVQAWIERASSNRELLYTVKLTDRYSEVPVVNVEKFLAKLNLPSSGQKIVKKSCSSELNQILELMQSEGLVAKNLSAKELNLINSLKLLLRRIENDHSLLQRVKIFGNQVQGPKLIHEFSEYELSTSIYNPRGNFGNQAREFFRNVFSTRVMELMEQTGLRDFSGYKPVAQRQSPETSVPQKSLFKEARNRLKINSADEFERLCESSQDAVYYLCALGARGVFQDSAIDNFSATAAYLKRYCQSVELIEFKSVSESFTEYFALKFRVYLEDLIASGQISPSWGSTMLSCLQLSLTRFSELDEANDYSYIKVEGFDTRGRTTDTYRPYGKEQRETIANVLEKDMRRVWIFHTDTYVKAESGQSFLKKIKNGLRIDGTLCTEENLRWFFDHKLGGERMSFKSLSSYESSSDEALFYKAVRKYLSRNSAEASRLVDLYELWGVSRDVYREELFPFYMRLLQVTGMNPVPALDLEIDSFEAAHPATLKPCLRYWKERSLGAKELHLDLFDSEITWLSSSQAKVVAEIFDQVKVLTESVRSRLPANHPFKNLLFIASGKPPKGYGKVKRLYESSYEKIRTNFEDRYRDALIESETGEKISLVGTRFRASLVSEMVEAGVSIREIQLMLGHGSITTTLSYLDRMDFNRQARTKIEEKLRQIYDNSWKFDDREDFSAQEHYRGEIIFKTPLGGCANIFNPPDFIKNSSNYDGGACSNFNKCLSCENVIITRSHLPDLFAMLRDYRSAWNNGSVASTPYGTVILENIDILESLLGDESEFEKSELKEAERLSRYIDSKVVIDGVAV